MERRMTQQNRQMGRHMGQSDWQMGEMYGPKSRQMGRCMGQQDRQQMDGHSSLADSEEGDEQMKRGNGGLT